MKSPADILRAAADTLDDPVRGWCQGTFADGAKRCVSRAISEQPYSADVFPVFYEYMTMPRVGGPYAPEGVLNWNDTLGRTKDEVTAALRACADAIEKRGEN